MRQAAEYFLLKTGRTCIVESEVEVLRELDKIHTASRVCREIDAVAEDFVRRNKSLLSLSLNYIFAKLRHQRTSPRAPDGRLRQRAVPDGEIDGISARNFSNYQVDNVVGLFASGVIETKEELGEVCDMWHLSEKEKERVFRAVENAGEIAGDAPAAVALAGNGD
jgi:hypothetical protein